MSNPINVVVIDDSAFMRKSISLMLESDPAIKVVATARDGKDGLEKVKQYRPDIVTLDVEMPVMDGITALKMIMKECPTPVIMLSSITTEGAKVTLEALHAGAIDFIAKDRSFVSVQIANIKDELIGKVKEISRSRLIQLTMRSARKISSQPTGVLSSARVHSSPQTQRTMLPRASGDLKAVMLGISTGGPFALLNMLPKLPASFPLGIAIVQHMPPNFTRSMAERLDSQSQLHVKEAEDGDKVEKGVVLIAPGGQHMIFEPKGRDVVARIVNEPSTSLYRPSADVMMLSADRAFHGALLGVIMTGMGKDGLEGLRAIKRKGGYVVAQNEESCVVYGMPKAAVDAGIADAILPLDEIASALTQIAVGKFAVAA